MTFMIRTPLFEWSWLGLDLRTYIMKDMFKKRLNYVFKFINFSTLSNYQNLRSAYASILGIGIFALMITITKQGQVSFFWLMFDHKFASATQTIVRHFD